MKTPRPVLLMVMIISLAMLVGAGAVWIKFLVTPLVNNEDGLRYQVRVGASFKSMATDLYNQHILEHPRLFMLLVAYRGDIHHLRAGEYLFPQGTTPNKMINQVVTGMGLIYHVFTIVPGMTFHQLRYVLNSMTDVQHTTQNLSDTQIMARLGHSGINPEGMFFPDTYYFTVNAEDLSLLKRSLAAMQSKVNTAWLQRASNLPFKTPYEALIAASIIEKEAYKKSELPIIAGVMVNRLRRGIMLQFDPTVIYGVGARYNGTIHRSDLTDNNPYNTYVHKGLPPTPISMPGAGAISAVMNPEVNDYLYFVARNDGGSHQFSATLAAHNAAVVAARTNHPVGFFNSGLLKQYLLKTLPLPVFSID